jgi:hypothetical protein
MAQIIFNDRIDMVAVAATPSSAGYTIGYDTDGVIKQKDSAGVVTPLFSSSSQNLIQTLNLGNDSGIYSIMMGTGTSIYSSNSTGRIKMDYNGSVFIYSTASSTGTSSVYLGKSGINIHNSTQYDYGFLKLSGTTHSVIIGCATSSLLVTQNKSSFSISHTNIEAIEGDNTVEIVNVGSNYAEDTNQDTAYVHINSYHSTTVPGVRNSVIVGGSFVNASEDFMVYIGQKVRINDYYTLPWTDGSANQYLRTDGLGNVTWEDFTAATAPLSDVLAVGNTSETYNIVMGTGTSLRSANGAS